MALGRRRSAQYQSRLTATDMGGEAGIELRLVALLLTRAVLLIALCGVALGVVGSMSLYRQQYFNAFDCGAEVRDVGIIGEAGVWTVTEAALAGRSATLMAVGADPAVRHVTGPEAGCLTGAAPSLIAELGEQGGFLVRDGSGWADRVRADGTLAGRPATLVSEDRWRGAASDAVVQPKPASKDVPSYSGFLVGDPDDLDAVLRAVETEGVEISASAAAEPLRAALAVPLLGTTALLTGLTFISVSVFWALTLRTGERSRLRVLRLLGVPPGRAAASRLGVSIMPFLGAVLIAASIWLWASYGEALGLSVPMVTGVVVAVALLDACVVVFTHLSALWMREVPQ